MNGFKAECKVHVDGTVNAGDDAVLVESITFNSRNDGSQVTEAPLVNGGWLGLVVMINNANATNQSFILSSSNESVATVVDQGLDDKKRRIAGVVGGFPGTTYITATIGGKTAICKITIEEPKMAANYAVPYIATRSFNALPTTDENVVIPYYMTDDMQSEYVAGDNTKKLNLVYEVDGTCKTQANLPMGEGELNLGKLPAGEHSIGIQAEDTVTGTRSHRVYLNVLVTEPAEQTYQVQQEELAGVAEGKTMTDKLNTIFTQKAGEGFNRILLPENGSYTIDGTEGGLRIPSGITVDLNGSTIKMAVSKGAKAAIVTMENVENAHITGGVLIGDRGESGASGAVAVRIKGGRYCTVSDMQIKNISGNAYVTERVDSAFKKEMSDGEIKRRIGEDNYVYSQTVKVDLTELKKESDYLMVGCQRGKMVVRSFSPNIYIRFYDSNQQLISTVEGYQQRQTKIPENARYADAEFCGGVYGDDYISFYFNALGENLEVTNVQFENISGTAILPSTFNNLLVEGCSFTNVSGRTATISQGGTNGAGGGWTEAQDLYFCNNQVTSGYKDIYFDTGRNIYLDNLKGQNITFGSGVLGGTIRNINDNGVNINWMIGSKFVCGYARIFDNNCKNINVTHIPKDKVFSPLFECRIKNCTIGGDSFNSNLEYIEYVNCTFTNFKGEVGVLRGCTLNEDAEIGKDIVIYIQ